MPPARVELVGRRRGGGRRHHDPEPPAPDAARRQLRNGDAEEPPPGDGYSRPLRWRADAGGDRHVRAAVAGGETPLIISRGLVLGWWVVVRAGA